MGVIPRTARSSPCDSGQLRPVVKAFLGRWHRKGVLTNHGPSLAARLPGAHHLALGGGGIGSLLIHLFIWHEIFRLFRYLWRIPTFGPFIVVLLGLILVGVLVWRQSRGPMSRGPIRWGRRGGSSSGYGSSGRDSGPRDW
jgi:hypothetical protein